MNPNGPPISNPDDSSKNDNLGLIISQFLNPIKYAKVLIQLGYEPIAPFSGHNLFSVFNLTNKTWRYPWIGSYIYFMYDKRGLLHILTTGLFARCALTVLASVSQKIITQHVCEKYDDEDSIEDVVEKVSWSDFSIILCQISLFKLYEVTLTHPLKVIMTRQMADFIVEKNDNAWFISAVKCIFKESGLLGFYKGMLPDIISELFKCTVYYFACRVVINMLISPRRPNTSKNQETAKLLSRSLLKYVFSNMFYPFEVVSTVMMMDNVYLDDNTRLSSFNSWRHCWRALKKDNQLQRGYSFIFRNHVKPA